MSKRLVFRASKLVNRVLATLGTGKLCYACNSSVGWFLPYRGGWKDVPRLMVALDVIGSDVGNFSCPRCLAHDRERHLLMYFDALSLWSRVEGGNVLHVAPERIVSRRIVQAKPAIYVKADLLPTSNNIMREDITRLSFPDCSFNWVIANHILEHVTNDEAAMNEIFRVLKPGGLAILQTPYSSKLQQTFSDNGVDDNEARLEAYGQEDHVRLYGRDLFAKLERVGFESRVCTHEQVLSRYDPTVYGINPREPFICYERTI